MKIKYIEKPQVFCVYDESLEEIAKKFGVSLHEIKKINNIEKVKRGMYIALPQNTSQQKSYYIVKPADTFDKISKTLGVSKELLKEKNNTSTIFVGQMLFY